MASFDRGAKRQCLNCGTKFYDLNRDPILCPNCGKPFHVEAARQAARYREEEPEVEEVDVEVAAEAAGAELVPLEEAEEPGAAAEGGDEIVDVEDVEDVEDIPDDDEDVFLEEDDEDGDIDFDVNEDEDER